MSDFTELREAMEKYPTLEIAGFNPGVCMGVNGLSGFYRGNLDPDHCIPDQFELADSEREVDAINAVIAVGKDLPRLLAELARTRAMLAECQRLMREHEYYRNGHGAVLCPECKHWAYGGHAPDCAWARAMNAK